MNANSLFDVDPDALNTPPPSPKQSHPVYSDFSHIASATGIIAHFFVDGKLLIALFEGIGSTRFAAGLREDNPEELLHRYCGLVCK